MSEKNKGSVAEEVVVQGDGEVVVLRRLEKAEF